MVIPSVPAGGLLAYRSAAGRWVVFATVLGSAPEVALEVLTLLGW